ncbi:MAG: biotin/lipoyl-binding protein [Pseudomonadales bacterium]|nr:biotin/lipoyl-binding protein [Pseudomonadales bacterium]NIX07823.1 biotin/lipoyl-binding protein [Pseudomonadales bacterium]
MSRILIANRGEIARRIIRTAHELGIGTVAVYADGDADAPFVREADTAIALGGRSSAETYLDVEKVIDACRRSGADAVHPGYGFLSENERFAQAVVDEGLRWIGPAPRVIGLMGDKLSAKRLMVDAGVPTLPAVEITEATDLAGAAAEVGYPVLVKASAGGGGRGMRVVEQEDQLADAVLGAKREAASSFGDDTVFFEKWLESSRHVEVQILGDGHGNVLHCFERECSIQRRHQKIIEEAPSPAVTPELRARMGAAAVAAAEKLGYSSAGTVEFLLSGEEFFFLEVNARLQVEHPVTEAVIGWDLVREQIRVAEGERLSFTQDALSISGHAIEARLYAEDPANDFLPSPGTVVAWAPSRAGSARFDSGVESGSVISTEFDPMIAKVIVHAPTRREAATRLARVLETTRIQGLTTNRDFLVATLRAPEFLAADTTTDFIERVRPATVRSVGRDELVNAAIAAAIEGQNVRRASARVMRTIPTGWRNSTMPTEAASYSAGAEEVRLGYRARRDGLFRFLADDAEKLVRVHSIGDGESDLEIDGQRLRFIVGRHGDSWMVHGSSGSVELLELPRYPVAGAGDEGSGLLAPMPGRVLETQVAEGSEVVKGQLLLILEAMKMEHRITAPRDGVVAQVHVTADDQVENGQLLVTLTEREG